MTESDPKKLELLIVASHLWIGGAEKVICDLCNLLDSERFSVRVMCLKELGSIGVELKEKGRAVFQLPNGKHWIYKYFSFLRLALYIKKHHITIVHTHTTQGLIDTALAKLFCPGTRTVHTFHFGNYPNIDRKYLLLERFFCRWTDRLVAVGSVQRAQVMSAMKLNERHRVDVIYNGVSQSQSSMPIRHDELAKLEGRTIVGTICTLIEQKGLFTLLDVAKTMKTSGSKAAFVIAGDGHLRAELHNQISLRGLEDTVYLLGWVDNPQQSLLPFFDVFFLPSLWEAMSIVLLEAMAEGKAILTTRVGESTVILDHGVTGFLVEPGDVLQMCHHLENLVSNPSLRNSLGTRALADYKSRFTGAIMVENYQRLFLDILK